MTDTYDPYERQATANAIGSIDDDPEQAARALRLSQISGIDPSVIHADVEGFDQQFNAGLTGQIVRRNQHLQDYINSHPLAAKVSNGDWHQLDAVSDALGKISPKSILGRFAEGFNEGVGPGGFGEWIRKSPGGEEYIKQAPLSAGLLTIEGAIPEGLMRFYGGMTEGVIAGAEEFYKQLTGDENAALKLARDLRAFSTVYFAIQHGPGHIPKEYQRPAKAAAESAKQDTAALRKLNEAIEATQAAEPWLKSGEEPPTGIHPLIDKIKIDQVKSDAKAFDNVFKESQAAATRERSEESFSNFVRLKDKANISISADAIRELYGEKEPHPEDNLLGWVPDLVNRLSEAEAVGGDVEISRADLLSKMDPEVWDELKDHVRFRPGGVTIEEGKTLREPTNVLASRQGERIESAALRLSTGQVFTGVNHGDAFLAAKEAVGVEPAGKEGFVTSTGRFVSRGEALEIAQRAEQIKRDVNKETGLFAEHMEDQPFTATEDAEGAALSSIKQLLDMPNDDPTGVGRIIRSVRTSAGLDPIFSDKISNPLKVFRDEPIIDLEKYHQDLQDLLGTEYSFGGTAKAFVPKEWTPEQQKGIEAAAKVIQKIAPKGVEFAAGKRVELGGRPVQGLYLSYENDLPIIALSLESGDLIGTGKHEALHHLRQYGFFKEDEWQVLREAAINNDWFSKHQINERYRGETFEIRLEEAIADEFKDWDRKDQKAKRTKGKFQGDEKEYELIDGMLPEEYYDSIGQKPPKFELPEAVREVFQKLKDLLDQIRMALKDAIGLEPTWQDLFKKAESGEIGKREGTKPLDSTAFKAQEKQPELPGTTRQEDLQLFKPNALGIDAKHYNKMMKTIDKLNTEAELYQMEQAVKLEKKRQTKEWKENEARVRGEAQADIERRPDVGVARFLGQGMLYGEDTHTRPKLKSDRLTKEQKEALPENLISDKGIDPDDVAGLFGYPSGDRVVADIIAQRQAQGDIGLTKWLEKEVAVETEKRMQKLYGNLGENILREAEEHVLSPTQMDFLHQETVAAGMRAGSEMTFTKADVKSWVKDAFSRMKASEISAKKFFDQTGRIGRLIENEHIDQNPTEALKLMQKREFSALLAKEAIAFEKEQKQFDRMAKKYSKREVSDTSSEYTNFIHDILMRIGEPVRRSVQDLQEAIQFSTYKNLQDFVNAKTNEVFGLHEFPIADFLLDESFRKSIDEMTVDEFRQTHNSLKALAKQGRDSKKMIVEGDAFDLAQVKGEMIKKLETFPEKEYPVTEGAVRKALVLPKTYLASGISNETLLNRWDRNDPRGIFNKYIVYPLAEAANHKAKLDRKYSKPYRALGEIKDKDKKLDSPLADPLTGDPLMGFTRLNAMAILQNIGNEGNWKVMTEGYKVDPDVLKQWLFDNTTKADWDRAQALGDIFGDGFKESENVYRNLYDVAPEKIKLKPIKTPYGTYRGWYHPLIKDPIREGKSKAQRGGNVYDNDNYGHAAIANGYTKQRTGAVYPLSLNFDLVPAKLSQMLHDIAFRQVIIETEKIYNDTAFRAAVTKHYGDIYKDGLMDFLKGVAGAESINSRAVHEGTKLSEFLRQNVISTYIGFNIYTALKHGPTALVLSAKEVGPVNFARAVSSLLGKSPEIGLSNSKFAMQWSEELQRRKRHWQDTVVGQHKDIYGESTLRESIIEKGSWLVALSDMASAKPTWLAAYRKSIEAGDDHGLAVNLADSAVRRAHGSTAITNQPQIVRGGGAMHGWLTSVYGFFGTMMQRRVELAHQINDTYKLGREGELKKAAANVLPLTAGIFAYVIWPTIVEEWVTGLTTDDKRGWGTHLFTASMSGMAASMIYVRDIVHGFVTGQEPSAGLVSSPLHDAKRLSDDLKQGKKMFDRAHAGRLVGDTITVFGEVTGMAPKEIGNVAKFGIDVARGHEKPKTFEDWRMGLTRGTIKKRVEK